MRRAVLVVLVIATAASSVGCRKLFRRRHSSPPYVYTAYTTPTSVPTVTSTYDAGTGSTGTGTKYDTSKAGSFLGHVSGCDEGRGTPRECNLLGIDYEEGYGTPINYVSAGKYYRLACDGKLPDGCANLGALYDDGKGFAEDKAKADGIYLQACNDGSSRGCNHLALHYLYAQGGHVQDNATAVKYFTKGCDKHDAYSCTNLGYMYWRGLGVKKDLPKMVTLYTEGCSGGDPSGCHNLGVQYEKGEGVIQSYSLAATYYDRACNKNKPAACYNLARLYEVGSGVALDSIRAKSLYKQGCDLGDKDSCQGYAKLP
jgi:TPR repeat protein